MHINEGKPLFKKDNQNLTSFINSQQKYPAFAKKYGIQGQVTVGFTLGINGNIKTATIVKGTGVDLDDEALRLVYLTDSYWQVPPHFDTLQRIDVAIQFKLPHANDDISKDQLQQAVLNYQNEQSYLQAITYFYSQIASGEIDTLHSKKITALKQELGINEAYFQQLLLEAKKAFKEGDHYTAKKKALKIKSLGSEIANPFLEAQHWK